MKRIEDDFAEWRLQQENQSKPFPYIFPQMPPRFRRCCRLLTGLCFLEKGCIALNILSILVEFLLMCFHLDGTTVSRALCAVILGSILLMFVCMLLRHTPKFFWRCPNCGKHFPYYAPPLRGQDERKESDCVFEMKHLRIRYVKAKFCPLVVPSACPECRAKFFEMTDDFSIRDTESAK